MTPRKCRCWSRGQQTLADQANARFLLRARPQQRQIAVLERLRQVTWSSSKDAEGRPIRQQGSESHAGRQPRVPGAAGATNWMSPTFDPQTGLFM